jgi:GrpB-like predicted nucleotidyltransferase (UPF0157 family)
MPTPSEPIEIADYDPEWPRTYACEAQDVRAAIAPWLLEIQHIGSTAVPGLPAKPVIDIMVGVRSLDASAEIVAALENVGYEYLPAFEGMFPFRRYFRRWEADHRSHQIHLVERDNLEWWDRHIAFRDWLRTHDDDRDAYAALKRSLAAIFRDDRVGYTDAKEEFVRAVEARAAAAKA